MSRFEETSLAAIFFNRVDEFGSRRLVYFKKDGVYTSLSWSGTGSMVAGLAGYLVKAGIKPGDKVALFSENRFEWWVADLAILTAGAVNVPIYATNSEEESRYIIEHSDSSICITGSSGHTSKILSIRESLPGVKEIISFDKVEGVTSLEEILEGEPLDITETIPRIPISSLATIIYTSGTTGNPKGVMLTHKNIIKNIIQCYKVSPRHFDEGFDEGYKMLSFLPLSHAFERTIGYYLPMYLGLKVAFAEDFANILENFQETRPHVIVSVPRLFEKIHAGILARASQTTGTKALLFNWMNSVARRNLPYICNDRRRTGIFAIEYALCERLVFSKIKKALGLDRLIYAFSAGSPLSVSDAEFFLGMGIKILEGYGLSETSPTASCNTPYLIKPGTVGRPISDTEFRIDTNGEVLIRGPQIMSGYYKNEAATKEVMTEDGFFRSGDIGEIDADGYLRITGRIKDLIITSGGKNVSPQNIENSLKASNFIEQVAIIGDNKKYLSALIVPSFEELEIWAEKNGVPFSSRKELIGDKRTLDLMHGEIETWTRDFARVEQIRKFKIMEEEWSQESGELTPTLKIKRRIINEKFAPEIEELYN